MHTTPIASIPSTSAEARRAERTHLFLAASLLAAKGACPVHVRNISATGALIEGSIVPEVGEQLRLRRGSLEASARIAWKAGRKAGVAFFSPIHVADWMARQPSGHQGRVDEIIHTIRTKPGVPSCEAGEAVTPTLRSMDTELRLLRATLTELEQSLIGDVVLVATHPEIQLLDIALQAVDRLLGAPGAP